MEEEETSFVVNVHYIPDTIMSDAEYRSRRDRAVESMLSERLATKGVLVMRQEVNEHELHGVPDHQRPSIILKHFERAALYEFSKQFDSNCVECPHRKIDVMMDHDVHRMGLTVAAKCYCGAKLQGGATCFDGYMPGSNSWLWPDYKAVRAHFKVDKPNAKGLVFAHLAFAIGREDEMFDMHSPSRLRGVYGDVRDEPPGPMTRINADSGYLTQDEIKMADKALAGVSKIVRASMPSPQPQTPCEDAW